MDTLEDERVGGHEEVEQAVHEGAEETHKHDDRDVRVLLLSGRHSRQHESQAGCTAAQP